MTTSIEVSDLFVSYFGKPAVSGVRFSIRSGELVGIIGPNGAGKSTVLKAILHLIPFDKGEVKIFGKKVKHMRKKMAYVPQRSEIDWDFPIHVLDTVLIGTYPELGLFRRPGKKEKDWAMECLKQVGMEKFYKHQIGELSGGQQQRVFIARALAQRAEIFLLDEPFVGIDMTSEEMIIQLLKRLRDEGKTIVVVHHDLSKANDYFDELILLNKELIHMGSTETVLQPSIMLKAYERELTFLKEIGVEA
ncbi:iron/zinc/copper transport system ATP-binding protein [Gracilibacillus halotolerans]|uniref:Iron/zinc/copper transport system ATP-binding protein n=1 Tax=Gracilibacillus halotolerans TaxID=74386 RepID=A0A841RCD1_9BACI|nr:metal ABC transporter ATP-binding protein [Gracilibacillus halotolerans]MBB6511590.1 iron/zinc/copper transport system ATP-binding protein [Gracilibacillus halotolerans]